MPGTDPVSTGAFHTADVPYWLNHFSQARADLWTDTDYMVGDMMSEYLANLAKNGDPNGEGLPVWSAFDSEELSYLELGDEIVLRTWDEAKTAFWEAWYEGI